MSVIYFVQAGAGGPIKIGVASNMAQRMSALQTGCPDLLCVLATTGGGAGLERLLHAKLRPHRLRGEWFRPAEAVLNAAKLAAEGRISDLASEPVRVGYFSHVSNLVSLVRTRINCPSWSKERLAKAAELHRNTLIGCDREDWNPTLATLLALERVLLTSASEEAAA